MKEIKVVITCEHGGNNIPKEFKKIFEPHLSLLNSHRGYDIGAWDMASALYKEVGHYFFHSITSRLLIELNRSLHNPNLFSIITKPLDAKTKSIIKEKYYFPYIESIDQTINELINDGYMILHISVHSFTPSLDGKVRNTDIGILYDPKQENEKKFSHLLKEKIKFFSKMKVRLNYPYLGIADGLPTRLRKKFRQTEYIGIELEVNQKYLSQGITKRNEVYNILVSSFTEAIGSFT